MCSLSRMKWAGLKDCSKRCAERKSCKSFRRICVQLWTGMAPPSNNPAPETPVLFRTVVEMLAKLCLLRAAFPLLFLSISAGQGTAWLHFFLLRIMVWFPFSTFLSQLDKGPLSFSLPRFGHSTGETQAYGSFSTETAFYISCLLYSWVFASPLILFRSSKFALSSTARLEAQ